MLLLAACSNYNVYLSKHIPVAYLKASINLHVQRQNNVQQLKFHFKRSQRCYFHNLHDKNGAEVAQEVIKTRLQF